MTNNAAERELRAVAIGRKNWTFAGSDEGSRRAAAIYTLIQTAKLNGIDPQAWLADVLARLPDHPASRITDLLPWNWKAAEISAAARTSRSDQRQAKAAAPAAFTGCVPGGRQLGRFGAAGGASERRHAMQVEVHGWLSVWLATAVTGGRADSRGVATCRKTGRSAFKPRGSGHDAPPPA
jgi:hypothetical protein